MNNNPSEARPGSLPVGQIATVGGSKDAEKKLKKTFTRIGGKGRVVSMQKSCLYFSPAGGRLSGILLRLQTFASLAGLFICTDTAWKQMKEY